jgi:glucose/mannose transport system permease protein
VTRRQHLWAGLVLVPALLSSAIFVYGFIAWTGYASLTDWNTVRRASGFLPPAPYLGIDNYEAVFATPRFWTNDVFANLVFTIVFVGGCIAMGLLLAILIDQHIRAESVFRSIFLFPMALSFVVTGTVWAWILNPAEGVNVLLDAVGISAIRDGLLGIGLLQPVWHALDSLRIDLLRPGLTADTRAVVGAIALAAVWQMSGFVMALYLAGLLGRLGRAARGGTRGRCVRAVHLPAHRHPAAATHHRERGGPAGLRLTQDVRPGVRAHARRAGARQ